MVSTRMARIPGTSIRVAALAGVVFFVLILVNGSALSGAPSATDPGRAIVDYVTRHQSRLQLSAALLVIGATAVVCVETHLFAPWFATASTVLALASVACAFAIGYTTSAIQIVAGITVVLDTVWILVVSLCLWRDPALALP